MRPVAARRVPQLPQMQVPAGHVILFVGDKWQLPLVPKGDGANQEILEETAGSRTPELLTGVVMRRLTTMGDLLLNEESVAASTMVSRSIMALGSRKTLAHGWKQTWSS